MEDDRVVLATMDHNNGTYRVIAKNQKAVAAITSHRETSLIFVKSIRTVRRSYLKRTSGRCRLDIYVLLKGEHLTRSNEDRDTGKTQVKSDEALRYKRINISRLVKFSLSFPPPIHLHCHVGHAVGSVIVGRQGPPEVEQQQKRAVPEHT